MKVPDFRRSYFRFYLDFEQRQVKSVSHRPPTKTNRVRVSLESICRLTHLPSDTSTTYALSAACRTERVGAGKSELWITPNAECIFLCSSDGQVAIYKNWHRKDPGVMLYPESLGQQPERQFFQAGENFDEAGLELSLVEATPLHEFDEIAAAVTGTKEIMSRVEYTEGDFSVCIEQPVKTINLAERDRLFQIDTGPIILPDLCSTRGNPDDLQIACFDLAYTAWHASDWAEFVIQAPLKLAEDISVNHYCQTRLIEGTRNSLLRVD